MALVPDESVASLLVTLTIEVPTPGLALEIVPTNDPSALLFLIPTAIGPANVEVAVDVEIMLPAINCPYAVVDASVAELVALSVAIFAVA